MRALVIILEDPDAAVIDNDVLAWDCDCGAILDLPHLVDYDRDYICFGGTCGKCGRVYHVDGSWRDPE